MSLELEIAIKNGVSRELKRIQNDLNRFNKTTNTTSNAVGGLSKSLLGVVASTYALSKAYDSTIKRGLAYNNLLVNQRNSIATLISVTSQNIDSMGKTLTYQDKMNLSLKNSNELMKELTKINANTPQTLGQTAQIFKTMYAPMQKVGASQKDLIFLTEKLAIASKVGGVEFNSLLAGVDGLASGTVLANSDLGRFLSSLGLTNKALKESGDVVELLKDKLKDFKAFDDLDTAVSNLNVQWDTLTGNMTKDIFAGQKQSVKELTGLIQALNSDAEMMDSLRESANSLAIGVVGLAVGTAQFINGLRITFIDIEYGIKNALNFVSLGFDAIKLEYLELSKSLQDTMNNSFKALGIDNRISLVGAFEIDELNDKMINTKLLIGQNINEWNSQEDSIHNQTQAFLDAEQVIIRNIEHQKEVTKEMEGQKKNALLPSDIKVEAKDNTESIKELDRVLSTFNSDFTSFYSGAIDRSNEVVIKMAKEGASSMKMNDAFLKSIKTELESYQQLNDDLGTSIADAITQGIDGSGLEEILTSFTSNIGKSFTDKGVSSLLNPNVAFDPWSLGIGLGLSAVGGLFGSSSKSAPIPKDYTSLIDSANYSTNTGVSIGDYDNNFDDFIDGLDKASERLEDFGSVGSSTSSEIDALTKSISSSQQNNADISKALDELVIETYKLGQTYYDTKTGKFESAGAYATADFMGKEYSRYDKDFTLDYVVQSNIDDYAKSLTASNNKVIADSTKELSNLLTEQVADGLDYDLLDKSQLEDLLSGFDLSAYNTTLEQINDLAILAKKQGGVLTEQQQQDLIDLYTLPNFIQGQDYEGAVDALQDFNDEILKMADNIDDAINSIRGNSFIDNTQANTSDLIRQYNDAINVNDFETASKLAVNISDSAFGDTSYLNNDLISSLESAKLKIGIEDEVLNVNIVSSELSTGTTTTPSVIVANQSVTSNDTMETILIELLKTNKRVEAILERIEDNQEQLQG